MVETEAERLIRFWTISSLWGKRNFQLPFRVCIFVLATSSPSMFWPQSSSAYLLITSWYVSSVATKPIECLQCGLPFICYHCPVYSCFWNASLLAKPGPFQILASARKPSPASAFCRSTPGI